MTLEEIKEKYPPYDKVMPKQCKDMTGKRFGKLTVLYRYAINSTGGQAQWVCQCDCGNISTPRGAGLRNGTTTTSCGCLTYENASKANKSNLVGKHFGKLTVIEDTGKRIRHRVIWKCKCKCECGKYVERSTDTLNQGDSVSCGHCNQSIGAFKIEQILKENHIQYEKEKTYPNLTGKRGMPYRYDFYLPEYNRLIEFDGIQHYKEREIFKDTLEQIQERDLIKNQYALKNDITLVRVPYWKQNTITLDTLLKDKYIIEE